MTMFDRFFQGQPNAGTASPEEEWVALDNVPEIAARKRAREAVNKAATSCAASGRHIADTRDIVGYRRIVAMREGSGAVLAGVTDNGHLLAGVAALPDGSSDEIRDILPDLARGLLDRRDDTSSMNETSKSVEQHDWLFTDSRALSSIAKERAERIAYEARMPSLARSPALLVVVRSRLRSDASELGDALLEETRDRDLQGLVAAGKLEKTLDSIQWASRDGQTIQSATGPKKVRPALTAVDQAPFFARYVAALSANPPGGDGAELTRRLDNGASPRGLAAEVLRIPPALVNHLSQAKAQDIPTPAAETPELIADLARIPKPAFIKPNRDGISEARAAVRAEHFYSAATGNTTGLRDIRGRFDLVAVPVAEQPPSGLLDMKRYIEEKLLLPVLWTKARDLGRDPEAATHEAHHLARGHQVLRDLPMSQAFARSAEWHKRRTALDSEITTLHPFVSWTPLSKRPIRLAGGVRAHELHDTSAFRAEAVSQDHCVDGHTTRAQQGNRLIYSLRKGRKKLSTIAIVGERDELNGTLEIEQNFGRSNTPASPLAEAAGRELVSRLGERPDLIDKYRERLRQTRSSATPPTDFENLRTHVAGYEIENRGRVEAAFQTLVPILLRSARKLDFEKWAEQEYENAAKRHNQPVLPAPSARQGDGR